MEDIDALLGCAICLPAEEVLAAEEFDGLTQMEKDVVCRCFFHAVNWLIEVINTFARSKQMRAKVVQRVRDVISLKEKFFKCLGRNPTFMPPPSVFFGEPIRSRVQPAASGAKNGAGTPKKKGAGKKAGGKKGQKKKKTDKEMADSTMASQQNKVEKPAITSKSLQFQFLVFRRCFTALRWMHPG